MTSTESKEQSRMYMTQDEKLIWVAAFTEHQLRLLLMYDRGGKAPPTRCDLMHEAAIEANRTIETLRRCASYESMARAFAGMDIGERQDGVTDPP